MSTTIVPARPLQTWREWFVGVYTVIGLIAHLAGASFAAQAAIALPLALAEKYFVLCFGGAGAAAWFFEKLAQCAYLVLALPLLFAFDCAALAWAKIVIVISSLANFEDVCDDFFLAIPGWIAVHKAHQLAWIHAHHPFLAVHPSPSSSRSGSPLLTPLNSLLFFRNERPARPQAGNEGWSAGVHTAGSGCRCGALSESPVALDAFPRTWRVSAEAWASLMPLLHDFTPAPSDLPSLSTSSSGLSLATTQLITPLITVTAPSVDDAALDAVSITSSPDGFAKSLASHLDHIDEPVAVAPQNNALQELTEFDTRVLPIPVIAEERFIGPESLDDIAARCARAAQRAYAPMRTIGPWGMGEPVEVAGVGLRRAYQEALLQEGVLGLVMRREAELQRQQYPNNMPELLGEPRRRKRTKGEKKVPMGWTDPTPKRSIRQKLGLGGKKKKDEGKQKKKKKGLGQRLFMKWVAHALS